MARYSVVDLFCGIGGLTHGFVKEGFPVEAGIDIDASCRYAYETNNRGARFIHKSIEDVAAPELKSLFHPKSIHILVGCAPCQPYSSYAKKKGAENEKWKLLEAFANLIIDTEPDIVSMENVPDLLKFQQGRVYQEFRKRLESRYHITAQVVYCPDYGIPQHRRRLVFFASRFGPIELVPKTHTPEQYVRVEERIRHLPPIEAGSADANDPLHQASGLSEINLERIRHSRPGGTWRDWPEELVTACHQKAEGKGYASVYGRMRWDEPSPTITTECNAYGSGRFGHPEQDRAISVREAAILQTFSEDYRLIKPNTRWSVSTIARQIGNAVPVELGRVIARSIKQHIAKYTNAID